MGSAIGRAGADARSLVVAARLVADYVPVLDQLPQLVSPEWLHLTMQGIGFADEIQRADIDRIVDAARRHCAELEPFTVAIGPARVDPESMHMPVRPVEPLAAVRDTIRAAIGEVWGTELECPGSQGIRMDRGRGSPAGPTLTATDP